MDGITTAVQTALTTIQTIFTTAWDGIKAIVETVVTVITTTLQNAWDIVSDGVTTAFEGIQQILQASGTPSRPPCWALSLSSAI